MSKERKPIITAKTELNHNPIIIMYFELNYLNVIYITSRTVTTHKCYKTIRKCSDNKLQQLQLLFNDHSLPLTFMFDKIQHSQLFH